MGHTWKNGKKPNFGPNFGPCGPNFVPPICFGQFTSNISQTLFQVIILSNVKENQWPKFKKINKKSNFRLDFGPFT